MAAAAVAAEDEAAGDSLELERRADAGFRDCGSVASRRVPRTMALRGLTLLLLNPPM